MEYIKTQKLNSRRHHKYQENRKTRILLRKSLSLKYDVLIGCFFVFSMLIHSFLKVILHLWASLVAQLVKNRLQSGRPGFNPWVGKIPLEKGKATHSSILAWRIPWTV